MKRFKIRMHKLLKVYLIIIVSTITYSSGATEIWVSTLGNDANSGTKESPLATINYALRKARNLRRLNDPSIKNGIEIILMDGVFLLNEPIFIRPEDSGTTESPTIIRSENNTKAIISGGYQIHNWKPSKGINDLADGVLWEAEVPNHGAEISNFRQLWVNGHKAIRAKNTSGSKMQRILSWDASTETCWIPFDSKKITYQPGMEMFIQQWWAIANLRIKDIEVKADSAKLYFEQPESRIQSEHPWPAPWISKKTGNSAFFLNNALCLLDEPGEWYLDRQNSKLYYYPLPSDTMETAIVVAPFLENLVELKGTIDYPVHHVYFQGVSFQYSNWLRPSKQGHVPLQAGMYMLDAYKLKTPGTPDKAGLENQAWIGRPRAAVEVNYANNIRFKACEFKHLSSTGLDFNKGTNNNLIQGNLFKDIGGSAINVGVFSDEAFETHLPFNPKDEREVCTNETIVDNLITNVTNEDWGGVGISAGFVKNIMIAHNEISDVSYTGIGLGWGWTKTKNAMRGNKVIANKIHHYGKHLYDTAGIYTLSAQPESVIAENVIDSIYFNPYAHDPYHWFYLYTDEGSSYFTVKNNWVPAEKFLQNANGPDNVWTNNNAFVSKEIVDNAGIRAPYKYLLKEKVVDTNWPLQEEPHFAAVEIVSRKIDAEIVKKIAKKNGVINAELYQWKKHTVLYAKMNHIEHLKHELQQEFPKAEIKTYNTPLYNFSNAAHCKKPDVAEEWEHVLLTANLVNDKALQNEYIEYHNTQFEKWPEVAAGFCNASFQQLQVFRNGRQLMLAISIPKGTNLDQLNPKTTQGNPRVNDWNALMQKYQTGIKGTKPKETWVFLEKLN